MVEGGDSFSPFFLYQRMKRLLLILLVAANVLSLTAQDRPLFIFDQFIPAKIYFKNRSVTSASMNYEAVNDKMYFKQNEDLMELTNAALIDSIVWAGKRSFVPYQNGFLELVNQKNGSVYIQWKISNVNIGSKGALGMVTQAKVENINIRSMGVLSAEDKQLNTADVYQQKNHNEYYVPSKGKLKKVRTLKQVIKLYPEHEEAIREFVKKEKIDMKEPLSVLALLDYCMGLGE